MRFSVVVLCALTLCCCAPSDQQRAHEQAERTREQAQKTAEQLKQESETALQKLEVDARKADKALNRGLENTREKVRGALNAPPERKSPPRDRENRP